jgi:ATP-dependent Clp protease ATP-binding subunit ClpA
MIGQQTAEELRVSNSFRNAVDIASGICAANHDTAIDPSHLLAAVLRHPDWGRERLGRTSNKWLAEFSRACEAYAKRFPDPGVEYERESTDECKDIVRRAVDLGREEGNGAVGLEHLLLSAFLSECEPAAEIAGPIGGCKEVAARLRELLRENVLIRPAS